MKLVLVFIAAVLLSASTHPLPFLPSRAGALSQSVYVWQQQASRAAADGINRAAPRVASFYLYSGLISLKSGNLSSEPANADFKSVAASGKPAVAVLRVDDNAGPLLRSKDGRIKLSCAIAEHSRTVSSRALAACCRVAELQLDFDCPTSQLGNYALLLRQVRQRVTQPLSITALPTWIEHSAFARVAAEVSNFVLQVHGIDRPRSIADASTICEHEKVEHWIAAAERLHRPFLVALPTHSYRLIFDSDGAFVRFAAENESAELPAGFEQCVESARPSQLAPLVQRLTSSTRTNLKGIVWFRLPVDTDRLNWSYDTWASVMEGRVPSAGGAAEVRCVQPGLDELWLTCDDGAQFETKLEIEYEALSGVAARELLAGFDEVEYGKISGNAPRRQGKVLVAWFRSKAAQPTGTPFIKLRSVGAAN